MVGLTAAVRSRFSRRESSEISSGVPREALFMETLESVEAVREQDRHFWNPRSGSPSGGYQ